MSSWWCAPTPEISRSRRSWAKTCCRMSPSSSSIGFVKVSPLVCFMVGLDLRGELLEVRDHDLAGLGGLLDLLRDLCLVSGEEGQLLFDGLFGRGEAGIDGGQMLLDDPFVRRELGLGGGSRSIEVAAHLHVEFGALVADLLRDGKPVVGFGQVRVVARALELQGTNAIFRRVRASSNTLKPR